MANQPLASGSSLVNALTSEEFFATNACNKKLNYIQSVRIEAFFRCQEQYQNEKSNCFSE